MKPCFGKRKMIAWLVLGDLDIERAESMREHIQACEGCRSYFNEISRVAGKLSAARLNQEVTAGASLHQKVTARIKAEEHAPVWRHRLPGLVRGWLLSWRIALPVTAGIAVIVGLLLLFSPKPITPPSQAPREQILSGRAFPSGLDPSIANYVMVASKSIDQLDELLTEQGRRNLPRAPIYTASGVAALE